MDVFLFLQTGHPAGDFFPLDGPGRNSLVNEVFFRGRFSRRLFFLRFWSLSDLQDSSDLLSNCTQKGLLNFRQKVSLKPPSPGTFFLFELEWVVFGFFLLFFFFVGLFFFRF